jgi:hypothetical protein
MEDRSTMSSRTMNQTHSIAELLSASLSPAAVAGILDEHVADPTGHCRGCRFPTTAPPVWPCRLWGIADEARRLRPADHRAAPARTEVGGTR